MYNYKREVNLGYSETVTKIKEELKKEGFGVLTEIDVKQTLKAKINVDLDKYIILGACNPSLAHQILTIERDIGVLLPCNLIVYVQDGKIFVATVLPTVQLEKVDNPKLLPIAELVENKLKKVVDII